MANIQMQQMQRIATNSMIMHSKNQSDDGGSGGGGGGGGSNSNTFGIFTLMNIEEGVLDLLFSFESIGAFSLPLQAIERTFKGLTFSHGQPFSISGVSLNVSLKVTSKTGRKGFYLGGSRQ